MERSDRSGRAWGRRAILAGLAGLGLVGCAGEAPEAGAPGGAGGAGAATIRLQVDYGSEKKKWMEEMIARFEAGGARLSTGEVVDVVGAATGSGEAMQAILDGASRPHVFSPASSAYLTLLNERWRSRPGNTAPLCGEGEALVLSPIVIAMWEPMARALGWPDTKVGWADLLKINADPAGWGAKGRPEWGLFKLGHTHPELSNSGLLSVLAQSYAATGTTRGLTAQMLADPKVEPWMAQVESSLVHYGKSTSFFLDKMLERGPGYISAAVLYENLVVESRTDPSKNLHGMPLVSLYPVEGTFWSDHPYAVVDAPQTGPKEREAAKLFLDFLKARPQQEAALQYGFRPGDPAIPMGAPLDAAHGVDPTQPQTLLEVPDGPTLEAVLALWQRTKKTSDVILVFDKSGSMRGEPLAQAKVGAGSFLRSLGARDTLSLQFFDNRVLPVTAPVALDDAGRAQSLERVQGVVAGGGTALYDAVLAAYAEAQARAAKDPGRIYAVLVMTDGNDENSSQTLPDVRAALARQKEQAGVRVFTIAYGAGADPRVLAEIAEAGGGATGAGDASNIDALFRDMAAFF